MTRIAVDAMGGDRGPETVVAGAALAAKPGVEFTFVGDERVLSPIVSRYDFPKAAIIHAPTVIGDDESPVMAIRRKKDSSLVQAVNLVASGEAEVVLSAGNTGAFMAASYMLIRTINGIERPALAPALPSRKAGELFVLLDAGANMDADATDLSHYGMMGSLYAERMLNLKHPRVALLNVGKEPNKGGKVVQEAYAMLKDTQQNFVGNIEARDIFSGLADVVICDGFVGNAVLKACEGLAETMFAMIKDTLGSGIKNKLGAALVKSDFKKLRKRLDYTEYGGAPLLGINGICVKSHGNSDINAIKSGIQIAINLADSHLVDAIENNLKAREVVI
jgi:glycerol-3-phosphate acyltransferase PlsX